MSEVISTGPDVAAVTGEASNPEAAQVNADTAQAQTDGAEGGEEVPAAPEKTFSQAELDAIVGKEKAKAEAKAERRVLKSLERIVPQPQQAQAPAPQAQGQEPPRRDQFASDDEWVDAKVEWKLGQREAKSAQERQQHQAGKTLQTTEKLYAEAAKIPGFDRDDFDSLPLTKPLVEALIESDHAPKLMAYLNGNPEEVTRIAGLSAARQAAEIGKLEVKVSEKPAVKPSKAPAPITPVGGAKTPVHDLGAASMDEYKAMRAKQGARWATR